MWPGAGPSVLAILQISIPALVTYRITRISCSMYNYKPAIYGNYKDFTTAKDQKHLWQGTLNVRVVRATLHQLHTFLRDEWAEFKFIHN
jgi:hypothetical protein